MEVLHESSLEKCLNPDEHKREWRKRYFVLKKATGSGTRTLEYYKEKEWKKQEPKGVLTLFSGYTAEKVNDPKKKHTFEVKTIDNFFVLSAATEESRDKWIEALTQHSAGKNFNVTLEETAKSKELNIDNEQCILQVTSSSVLLLLGSSPAISWPFNCIRRYKCHPGIFLLEVGRKAPTGEGEFRFITQEGQDIFEVVGKAVASRMSSKKGNDYQTDFMSGFSPPIVATQDLNILGSQAQNITKANMFLDHAGRTDNVRFVMKKRSTSSPPPSPPQELASSPPTSDIKADDYSHLKFSPEKVRTKSEDADYDQLARAKECNRFNKTRMSDSRHPSVSSNKALKVLGLIRSNSADSLPRAQTESTSSESSDSYAHLEFNHQKVKKSQSSSDVLMDELKGAALNFKNRPDNAADKRNNEDVFHSDNVYNKLHSDKPTTATTPADDSLCPEGCTTDETYDRLGPNQHHHRARPEPIIMMDDAYDALSFGLDKIALENKGQQSAISNSYEEAVSGRPSKASNVLPSDASKVDAARKNFEAKIGPKPSGPPLASKPSVAKKPIPAKPPRKKPQPVTTEAVYANSSQISGVETGPNDVKSNMVAQLKKNLECQGFMPSTTPPKSPPTSAKKPVQPFYAVSPFTGSNKPQTVQSEYDIPSNNAPLSPAPAEHKPIDFMYAVSPFHSGNKVEASQFEENLYDSPSQQLGNNNNDCRNLYDTPMPNANSNKGLNLYDTPKQQSEYDVVKNVRPVNPNINDASKGPNKQIQFMYAVSPFAGGHTPSAANGKGSYDAVGGVLSSESYDEAGYCEVGALVRKPQMAGYAEVGETFNPNEPESESLYSVPRSDRM